MNTVNVVLYFVILWAVSFGLTALSGRLVLPVLRALKANQTEREEGPESHKVKNGTPTMGGLIFLPVFAVIGAVISFSHREVLPILISTVLFGLIGFFDDYLKVMRHHNLGLRAWQKFSLQILAALLVIFSVRSMTTESFEMLIPFSSFFTADGSHLFVNLGYYTVPLIVVAILGTVNGANFTDGIDGLLSSVSIVICLFIAVVSGSRNTSIEGAAAVMIGCLCGFLLYNAHPAKVFMGDTGSLAIGGFVAAGMASLKLEFFIITVAFIYLAEVLSVIIQVLYFKATHGRRIFRMAPIHHHFELGGWSETKVVRVFTLVTVCMAVISYLLILNY